MKELTLDEFHAKLGYKKPKCLDVYEGRKFNKIDMEIYADCERDQMIYLLIYKDKYFVKQNLDGTFEIECNFGKFSKSSISVHNFPLKNEKGMNTLKFCLTLEKGSKSAILLERKLKESGVKVLNTEFYKNGECTFDFPEKDLPLVEDILKVRKRRILSDEQREEMKTIFLKRLKNDD